MENSNIGTIVKETLDIAKSLKPTDTMFKMFNDNLGSICTEQVVIKENLSYPTRVVMCYIGSVVGVVGPMKSLGYELVSDVVTETSIYELVSGNPAPQLDYALFKNNENETILVATVIGNMVKNIMSEIVEEVVGCINEKMTTTKLTDVSTVPLVNFSTGVNKIVLTNDEFKFNGTPVDFYILQGGEHQDSEKGLETIAYVYFNECSLVGKVVIPIKFLGSSDENYHRLMLLKRPNGDYVLIVD